MQQRVREDQVMRRIWKKWIKFTFLEMDVVAKRGTGTEESHKVGEKAKFLDTFQGHVEGEIIACGVKFGYI